MKKHCFKSYKKNKCKKQMRILQNKTRKSTASITIDHYYANLWSQSTD